MCVKLKVAAVGYHCDSIALRATNEYPYNYAHHELIESWARSSATPPPRIRHCVESWRSLGDPCGRLRRADKIALNLGATFGPKERQLLLGRSGNSEALVEL